MERGWATQQSDCTLSEGPAGGAAGRAACTPRPATHDQFLSHLQPGSLSGGVYTTPFAVSCIRDRSRPLFAGPCWQVPLDGSPTERCGHLTACLKKKGNDDECSRSR